MYLALLGYLMIVAIMYPLLKGKATPIALFIVIPILFGLLAGFSVEEINGFVAAGVSKTFKNAALFLFSVIFFGIMNDEGAFDPLVAGLIKMAGNNVVLITVATGIIAVIGHLDGATATTVLVTIPAMYPLYKKMKMSPLPLLTIVAAAMGVMNLVPWGGPTARTAVVTGIDANIIWKTMIPIQVVGVLAVIALGIVLGLREKAKGAGVTREELIADGFISEDKIKFDRKTIINISLILLLLVGLFLELMDAHILFMIFLSFALVLNYPNAKKQTEALKKHAPSAFLIAGTLIASGVFVGILSGNESEMLNAMSNVLLSIIPGFIAQFLHIIMGILGMPLGMVLGTDAFFYGLMPLCIEVGQQYGISQENMAYSMLIGKNVGLLISPLVPATWLALGMVEVEFKDHLRYSFIPLFIVSVVMVLSGLLFGIIAL